MAGIRPFAPLDSLATGGGQLAGTWSGRLLAADWWLPCSPAIDGVLTVFTWRAMEAWRQAAAALRSGCCKRARSGGHLPDLRGHGPSSPDQIFSVMAEGDTENYPGSPGRRREIVYFRAQRSASYGRAPAARPRRRCSAAFATHGRRLSGGWCRLSNFPWIWEPTRATPQTCAGAVGSALGRRVRRRFGPRLWWDLIFARG